MNVFQLAVLREALLLARRILNGEVDPAPPTRPRRLGEPMPLDEQRMMRVLIGRAIDVLTIERETHSAAFNDLERAAVMLAAKPAKRTRGAAA